MIRVIYNPISGRGLPIKLLSKVCDELTHRALAHEVVRSMSVGHIRVLTEEAVQSGNDGLVILGGDGSLNEVVNGLNGSAMPVYIVPCGTGNDFIKSLSLPKDPIAALVAQLDRAVSRLDLAQLNEYHFLNAAGTGFDIEVIKQTERYKQRHSGLVAYLLGVFQAIRHYKPLHARITVDGQTVETDLTIVAIANGQFIGGGMRVAPQANTTDGLLDVIYVEAVSRPMICLLLPLFVLGTFVRLPITHMLRGRDILIEAPDLTVNMDGELKRVPSAHIKVLPGAVVAHLA